MYLSINKFTNNKLNVIIYIGDKMLTFDNIDIKIADNLLKRFVGLMFKKNIDYGLLFKNCKSIHTFFMLDNIDVVACDINDNIIMKYKNVKPWKIIIAPKGTKNIYELPKNTLK